MARLQKTLLSVDSLAVDLRFPRTPDRARLSDHGHNLRRARRRRDRRRRVVLSVRLFDVLCERGHRRPLEDDPQRYLGAGESPQTRDELSGEKAVAAEVEEVVVYAYLLDAEHVLPDPPRCASPSRRAGRRRRSVWKGARAPGATAGVLPPLRVFESV